MNGDSYSRDGRRPRDPPVSTLDTIDNLKFTDIQKPHRGERGERGERDERRDRHRDRDRRRSRSPDHRSNRRGDGDADAYSSSRNHRDREREDRYSGRDRRGGDREWDRERGATRRDARRDDDDRFHRREREPFDDRRRGGRERRDDGPPRQENRRSASPPPKKREPTPDLTDIISILERKRRLTQWDIKPPGYDHVTAEQAKLSGMFPLPGAPRQQAMDPTKLQAMMNQPGSQVSGSGLKALNSRQSKRLVVSRVPPGTTEDTLLSFFNLQLNGLNVIEAIDPCVLCQFSTDHAFAVLEFRDSQDATVALALDGITMEADDAMNGAADGGNHGLDIRRPKDYVMPAVTEEVASDPDVVSNIVPDTINKLCITNVPTFLTDDQVIELLAAFGKPKAFVLVKDRSTEESRGIALAEYLEPTKSNPTALETLNGMDVGGKKLKVTKACIGPTQVANFDIGITAISGLASQTSNEADASSVLQLLNMVTPEELLDNDDYQEICDDVREECSKFGTIVDLKVPRPVGGSRQSSGVGKIFIKFATGESTTSALKALAGRKFADRTVVATYFPEENFDVGAW